MSGRDNRYRPVVVMNAYLLTKAMEDVLVDFIIFYNEYIIQNMMIPG